MAATAWLWVEVPVRVHWAAVAAQCAWAREQARAFLLVPAVRLLVLLSLVMTVMILLEKLFLALVCYAAKALGHKPERRGSDSVAFPVVLVQIPMDDEREVSSALVLSTKMLIDFVLTGGKAGAVVVLDRLPRHASLDHD
uniref:Uncharacterized protein n=1 Tax=Aegilops tauschii TaxID=37682 RepID=R7VZI5_AEGTA